MNPKLSAKDLLLQFNGNIDHAITCAKKLIIYIPFVKKHDKSPLSSFYWHEVLNELKKLKS